MVRSTMFRVVLGFSGCLLLASPAGAVNIVVNGEFEGVCTPDPPHSVPPGWMRTTQAGPDAPIITCVADNGPSAPGMQAAQWVRVTGTRQGRQIHYFQAVSATAAQNPQLSLDVKVISHNLVAGGTVTPAFEWPVRVNIAYTLASNPGQTQAWRHGFYTNPPGDGPRVVDPGSGIIAEYKDTQVTAGVWTTHTFNLATELPDLGEITEIRIGGGGWAFEGQVDNVVLDVECPPSQPPTLQKQFFTDHFPFVADEAKNRILPIKAGDAGQSQTIRVTWDDVANWPGGHHPALHGQQKYLQQPFQVCENSGQGLDTSPPNCGPSPGQPQRWFWAARLTCSSAAAFYGNIAGLTNHCTGSGEACTIDDDCAQGTCGVDGVIHFVDEGIVPSKRLPPQNSTYTVQVIDSRCLIDQEESYSDPLEVTNAVFGDVGSFPGKCPYTPPDGVVTVIGDVTEAINKFSNSSCAPKKTRVEMAPGSQDLKITFTDVVQILAAFQGRPYPFAAPPPCPAT